MILMCFGFLGAGMAARALLAHPTAKHRFGSAAWLLRPLTVLAIVLFTALNSLPDPLVLQSHSPPFFTWGIAVIKTALGMFGRLPEAFSATVLGFLAIENLAWMALLLALICFAIELLIRGKTPAAAPFDHLASSSHAARRFIWLVIAFIVLCLAAMPTLIVAGQALLHVHARG